MEKFMTFKISKIRYFDYFVSVEQLRSEKDGCQN